VADATKRFEVVGEWPTIEKGDDHGVQGLKTLTFGGGPEECVRERGCCGGCRVGDCRVEIAARVDPVDCVQREERAAQQVVSRWCEARAEPQQVDRCLFAWGVMPV
jgi:hypothetical protein